MEENVWRVMFLPDQAGTWKYEALFRKGDAVAVSRQPSAGESIAFDGVQGTFDIVDVDSNARGLYRLGRLEYVGDH